MRIKRSQVNGFNDEEACKIICSKSLYSKLNTFVALAADITKNRDNASDSSIAAFFTSGYANGNLLDLILPISDKTSMNYLHKLTKVPVDFPLAPAI